MKILFSIFLILIVILSKNILVFYLNNRYIRELNENSNIKLNEFYLGNILDNTEINKNVKPRTKYYDESLFIKDDIFNCDINLKKNNYGCINGPNSFDNVLLSNSEYIYNWDLGKRCLSKFVDHSNNFSINNMKYSEWDLINIPTVGYDINGERVQRMFETNIWLNNENNKYSLKLFIKKVPIDIWLLQFKMMELYNGEFLYGGENYVMEAVVGAFLTEHHPGISPRFYKLLYEPENYNENLLCLYNITNIFTFNDMLRHEIEYKNKGDIVMIWEYFGQNLLKYLNIQNILYPLGISNKMKKKRLLYGSLELMKKFHDTGLCHLDFTVQNILINKDYEMRLCDFAKSTPMYTNNLRHIEKMNHLCSFESCIPYVAKLEYSPPECLSLRKIHKKENIKNPLKYLCNTKDQEIRKKYYFDVASADKYMLGIVFIFIWIRNFLWKRADEEEDKCFLRFVKNNMNFDKDYVCIFWPKEFKEMLKGLLNFDSRKSLNLNDLINHRWFMSK
ncbi:serine/threonine protein kinase, FIKK family, putative [Plasmodium sp. gorilla clade G2]|uniref:serine/threonine protein kinase, FIKK family, putative n=1 Tax=Plasmodium sp. gorilla clade G2 TaxID=880535 RepID=UPI000D21467D|nr:serine/threonine protein kinase, FIKK family, putative [Plasmodium sp. gorilla clade G2]SOV13906.1 serine/threonine protein kinase, FIKK family, putative [Plasmodium sp. gorilla clade G2]